MISSDIYFILAISQIFLIISPVDSEIIDHVEKSTNGENIYFKFKMEDKEIVINAKINEIYNSFVIVDKKAIKRVELNRDKKCHYTGYVEGYSSSWAKVSDCKGLNGDIILDGNSFTIKPLYQSEKTTLNDQHKIVLIENSSEIAIIKEMKNLTMTRQIVFPDPNFNFDDNPEPKQDPANFDGSFTTSRVLKLTFVVSKNLFDTQSICDSDIITCVRFMNEMVRLTQPIMSDLGVVPVVMKTLIFDKNNEPYPPPINMTINIALSASRNLRVNFFDNSPYDVTVLLLNAPVSSTYMSTFANAFCDLNSAGFISLSQNQEINAAILANMIGNVWGLRDSDTLIPSEMCSCDGICIMSSRSLRSAITGKTWSNCDIENFKNILDAEPQLCIFEFMDQEPLSTSYCGNGRIDKGEECDCTFDHQCEDTRFFECCNPITCKLKGKSECSNGDCCKNCKLREFDTVCKGSNEDCFHGLCNGIDERCFGTISSPDGTSCNRDKDTCFLGRCVILDNTCSMILGSNFTVSSDKCYERFNIRGDYLGNCGPVDINGNGFVPCEQENLLCGKLLCEDDSKSPAEYPYDTDNFRCIVPFKTQNSPNYEEFGTVPHGAQCGDNKVCVDHKCVHGSISRQFYIKNVCGRYSFLDDRQLCECNALAIKDGRFCFLIKRVSRPVQIVISIIFGLIALLLIVFIPVIVVSGFLHRYDEKTEEINEQTIQPQHEPNVGVSQEQTAET